ncbi:MAG: hypothetical protein IPN59_08625 [Holophaga sp.]|nr:hypothetical protein [Holophaga sp.]
MRIAFALLLFFHGLIHVLGLMKSLDPDKVPQLVLPISRRMGFLWLLAEGLFTLTLVALFVLPGWWWLPGLLAVVLSQGLIFTVWRDARFGTFANVMILTGVSLGFLMQGPLSLRAEYDREQAAVLTQMPTPRPITQADLDRLPGSVRHYLQMSALKPAVATANFQARFKGRIRSGPQAPWMPFTAQQTEAFHTPVRLFYMDATMRGFPVQVLHVYRGTTATMRVKALGLVTLVDAKGPALDRAETVTLFNDMCVLAPGSLTDPRIRWQALDDRHTRATFTNGGQTITADLFFNEQGELVDFHSDDRTKASSDGKTFDPAGWTTPLRAYRSFGPWRLSSRAEVKWHPKEGAFTYGEFELQEITHNLDHP